MPMADDAGQCNEANYAGFEVAVPAFAGQENSNTCARQVQNLEEECADTFGWGRFSEDLYAGTTGTVLPADVFDSGDYVPVRKSRDLDNERTGRGICRGDSLKRRTSHISESTKEKTIN